MYEILLITLLCYDVIVRHDVELIYLQIISVTISKSLSIFRCQYTIFIILFISVISIYMEKCKSFKTLTTLTNKLLSLRIPIHWPSIYIGNSQFFILIDKIFNREINSFSLRMRCCTIIGIWVETIENITLIQTFVTDHQHGANIDSRVSSEKQE